MHWVGGKETFMHVPIHRGQIQSRNTPRDPDDSFTATQRGLSRAKSRKTQVLLSE